MKKINFKEKDYEFPERLGLLPRKSVFDIKNLDLTKEESTYEFIKILLGVDDKFLDGLTFEEYVELNQLINSNFSYEIKIDKV